MGSENDRYISMEKAKRIVGLKGNAFNDYLSARVLLNQELLFQGAILANTAIEKEIKGYLEAIGIIVTIKHNSNKLYNLLHKHKPDVASKLNKEFIKELSRIYEARYTDSLPANFNFTIVRNKYLVELDYTYSILEPLFRYNRASEKKFGITRYEDAINKKDSRLFLNNCVLKSTTKEALFSKPDAVYEFRIIFNHEIFEVSYIIPSIIDDGKFKFEAIKPLSNSSFRLSHKTEEPGYF